MKIRKILESERTIEQIFKFLEPVPGKQSGNLFRPIRGYKMNMMGNDEVTITKIEVISMRSGRVQYVVSNIPSFHHQYDEQDFLDQMEIFKVKQVF